MNYVITITLFYHNFQHQLLADFDFYEYKGDYDDLR